MTTKLDEIHDNFLIRYVVDEDRREFTLLTEYRDSTPFKRTEVTFKDILCYHLRNHTFPTIVFGIEEIDSELFLKENKELFDLGKNYGWPGGWLSDPTSTTSWFTEKGYTIFSIQCSTSLDGWIIARKVTTNAADSKVLSLKLK